MPGKLGWLCWPSLSCFVASIQIHWAPKVVEKNETGQRHGSFVGSPSALSSAEIARILCCMLLTSSRFEICPQNATASLIGVMMLCPPPKMEWGDGHKANERGHSSHARVQLNCSLALFRVLHVLGSVCFKVFEFHGWLFLDLSEASLLQLGFFFFFFLFRLLAIRVSPSVSVFLALCFHKSSWAHGKSERGLERGCQSPWEPVQVCQQSQMILLLPGTSWKEQKKNSGQLGEMFLQLPEPRGNMFSDGRTMDSDFTFLVKATTHTPTHS